MSICFGRLEGLSFEVRKTAFVWLIGIALSPIATAQSSTPDSSAILSQAIQAFSSGKPISSIELIGTAVVHEGGPPDEGNATLTADATGKMEMKLNLRSSGERIEAQDSNAVMMTCMWKKSDGVEHKVRGAYCQTPLVWFLPIITLQAPDLSNQRLTVSDLGNNGGGKPRRSLAVQFSSPKVDDPEVPAVTIRSPAKPAKLELESNSLLPESYKYSLSAMNSTAVVAFEIRFSDYRKIGDTQVPFLIQRYVNGALQLEIHVSEAQITN